MRGTGKRWLRRVAGALVALLMSGAPQLLEAREPAARHRCHCPVREGRHDCDCPLCHAEASRAAPVAPAQDRSPPCHGALAARAGETPPARRQAPCGPTLTSSCGDPEGRVPSPLAGQSFPLPSALLLTRLETVERIAARTASPRSTWLAPEPPPPRQG
jgi:hypothetical protein